MMQSNNAEPLEIKMIERQDLDNLEGFIKTLTEEPSFTPRKFNDQFVIVTTGGSSAAYIYDTNSKSWKKVTIA